MEEGGGGGKAGNDSGNGNDEQAASAARNLRLHDIESAVSTACSSVMGIEISPEDDFLAMGGDSLSALAVSKRLVEMGGGTWPIDGVIHGRLAACEIIRSPVIRDYSALLLNEGYTPTLPAPCDTAKEKEQEEEVVEKEEERGSGVGAAGGRRRGDDAALQADRDLSRALRRACAAGDDEGVRRALELGADANDGMPARSLNGRFVDTFEGVPPLHVAAARGGRESVRILLDAGAKVGFPSQPATCEAGGQSE